MKRNSMKQLLMSSNYFVLNKQLVKALGIETAFLLSALVEADEMLADENGWFYQTVPQIEKMTGLKKHKQNNCIEQLINFGILLQENKGMPMKRYFKLNYDEIVEVLFSCEKETATKEDENEPPRATENGDHGSRKTSTNKELNINNLDKELNNKKDDDNINNLDCKEQEKKEDIKKSDDDIKKTSVDVKNNEVKEEKRDIKNKEDIKEDSPNGSSSPFDIKTFKAIKATGAEEFYLNNLMTPSKYRDINLTVLLEKIKESDFLMGKKDIKPDINNFTVKEMLYRIMADGYKNKKTTQEKEFKNPAHKIYNPQENKANDWFIGNDGVLRFGGVE